MKGTVLFQLLKILSEETDSQHRMSAQMLLNRMYERFQVRLNRRTLKTYLDDLIAAGCPVMSECHTRILPDGSSEEVRSDWYLEPKFEVSELRLLHDLLSAMPFLPDKQRREMIGKLEENAAPSFRESVPESAVTYLHRPAARQLLYSVELLCEAIRKNCMVQFQYGTYVLGENGKPELRLREKTEGTARQYFVSPYEIVAAQGKYYLICCKEPNRSLANYRVDRILDIQLKEEFARLSLSEVTDSVCYPAIPAEQLYMYRGETVSCTFRVSEQMLSVVLDWFGESAEISRLDENDLIVHVQVHPVAMRRWAMQFSDSVTVLEPDSLRNDILLAAQDLRMRYDSMQEPDE